jgi:hypothetical protein
MGNFHINSIEELFAQIESMGPRISSIPLTRDKFDIDEELKAVYGDSRKPPKRRIQFLATFDCLLF